MTGYERHVEEWSKCERCSYHKTRDHVVMIRGCLPAPVLLIGEAPGVSEDVLGVPFVGPAGRLLDKIIDQGLRGIKFAVTNLVGCLPMDGGDKGEPNKKSILACRPRLLEVVDLCRPKIIVCVGQLSKRWMPEVDDVPQVAIIHPAAILRMDASQRPLAIKRCIVTLREAAETHVAGRV